MELLFTGLIGGAIVSYFIFQRFSLTRKKSLTEKQSVVLLDKIKKVSKLITVEGDFSEIYHHEDTEKKFLGFSSKKKAIILINAKVHVGFDFRKIKLEADNKKKQIIISNFPKPEVLSIDPDIKFYDIQNGYLNKFDTSDLTALSQEAKEYILEKVPESNLMITASNEAKDAILLIENLVETIGWQLDYSALEIPENNQKLLN